MGDKRHRDDRYTKVTSRTTKGLVAWEHEELGCGIAANCQPAILGPNTASPSLAAQEPM